MIWITGLSGSGKTTFANALYQRLKDVHPVVVLDGDCVRAIMGDDMGYDLDSRKIMGWRMARLCQYLTKQNLGVICATISMHKEIHAFNRENQMAYCEVLIDVALENLIRRDKNHLYSRALHHEIANVVGVDIPFDKPEHPDVVMDNNDYSGLEEKVDQLLRSIKHIL